MFTYIHCCAEKKTSSFMQGQHSMMRAREGDLLWRCGRDEGLWGAVTGATNNLGGERKRECGRRRGQKKWLLYDQRLSELCHRQTEKNGIGWCDLHFDVL